MEQDAILCDTSKTSNSDEHILYISVVGSVFVETAILLKCKVKTVEGDEGGNLRFFIVIFFFYSYKLSQRITCTIPHCGSFNRTESLISRSKIVLCNECDKAVLFFFSYNHKMVLRKPSSLSV